MLIEHLTNASALRVLVVAVGYGLVSWLVDTVLGTGLGESTFLTIMAVPVAYALVDHLHAIRAHLAGTERHRAHLLDDLRDAR